MMMPTPLGKFINTGGKLQNIKFKDNGGTLILTPYLGPKAKLQTQLVDNWKAQLLITNPSKNISTMISPEKATTLIPGTYFISQAFLFKGDLQKKPEAMLYGSGGKITLKEGNNELEIKVAERMQDIERLQQQIKEQQETISKIQNEIDLMGD